MVNTLTEIWGEPGSGKTHAALSGWPDPLLVDTAFTSLGFREIEVDPDPDEKGESWPVLLKLNDYDQEAALDQYLYLESWPSDYEFAEGHDTVIIDNAADLRVIAVKRWSERTGNDWPQQAQWGEVNDMIDELIRHLKRRHHVVIISQMKDEYKNGDRTGGKVRDGPKRMDYKADFRIEMEVDGERERHAWVRKNRHMDAAGGGDDPNYGARGSDLGSGFTYDELMMLSGVPEEEW